jgi:hypothetical protein
MYQGRSRPERRPKPRPVEIKDGHQGQSPKEVMAAIRAVTPGEGPLGPFLNAPTLRAGDIVATTKGLMVYNGRGGRSHTASEFVSIASASGLLAGKKRTLISLDAASRRGPQEPLAAGMRPMRHPDSEAVSSATAITRSAGP